MNSSSAALLKSRRFLPLFVTQALGALNDNLCKNAMVVLALFGTSEGGPALVALAGGLFILPFGLFSATAGQLADRHDKSWLIRRTKVFELALMILAAAGFMTGSIPLLLAVLFGLGTQSAFFGPLKYAILPDHLRDDELVAGNGLIEAGTFLAILAGTVSGSLLILGENGQLATSLAGVAVSLAGLAASWRIPPAPPPAPDIAVSWNFIRETGRLVRLARDNRPVWLSILGLSWFWTVGATLLSQFPVVARDELGAGGEVVTLFLTLFAIGVGVGSVACARLLRGEVSAWPVPFAALGISLFSWDFARAADSAGTVADVATLLSGTAGLRLGADLLLLAACGGIFSVPLYAILQEKAGAAVRSRMIACNNILNAAFMVVGAGVAAGLSFLGWGAPAILFLTAGLNLAVALWIIRLVPQEMFRVVFRWYFRSFHAARIAGLENIAKAGPRSVVVVNHLSFLDGCFIAAFLPGRPVFAIDTAQAQRFRFLSYLIDLFPIDPTNPMATKSMVKAVRDGRQLVIFPEGRITLTGALMKIYDGPGTIADKADASLLPVRIDGLQFHKTSRLGAKVRQRWFPVFTMTILPPRRPYLDPELRGKRRREALTRVMQDIMTEAAFRQETTGRSLFGALIDARNTYGKDAAGRPRVIVADALRTEATYDRLLLGAVILGRKLAGRTEPGEHVGVLLPNSVGFAVAFFGLQAFGRVPAMLNFSAGPGSLLSACATAQIRTVLTSRAFIVKGKLEGLVATLQGCADVLYLEDLRQSVGLADKLRGKLASLRPDGLPGA